MSGSINGSGNAIVVPIDSKVTSLKELKGQTISVPFASTAHGLLLRAIQAEGWQLDKDIKVIAQAPEVAGPALKVIKFLHMLTSYHLVSYLLTKVLPKNL